MCRAGLDDAPSQEFLPPLSDLSLPSHLTSARIASASNFGEEDSFGQLSSDLWINVNRAINIGMRRTIRK